MEIIGIICEYNPFHNGHLYHIEQIKKMSSIHKLNRRVKEKGLQKNSYYEYIEKQSEIK